MRVLKVHSLQHRPKMLTGLAQYLSVQSPSATTVSYTVSNALPVVTPSFRLLRAVSAFLRVLLCVYVVLLDLVTAEIVLGPKISFPYVKDVLPDYLDTAVQSPARTLDWRFIGVLSLAILYSCARRRYTEESLLVLRGLGIQTSTSSPYFFSTPTTTFIPTTQIQDIVIHEAFKGLEVRFYLAVIVEGATEVVVVFPVGAT